MGNPLSASTRPFIGQLMRFGVSTLISASITIGLPVLLHELFHVPEQRAVFIAFNVALVVNFIIMRHFVFAKRGSAAGDMLRYAVTNIAFRLAEYAAFSFLFRVLHLYYVLAIVVVLIGSTTLKFVAYRFLVFDGRSAGRVSEA
jgi:putative flippase GtrA